MNELTSAIPAHLMERPQAPEHKDGMGKDDFMKLLMAQLQNQDPLDPLDHKEFAAQLSQFASLEKLTQIGGGIEKLEGGMGEEAKLQALGMIGKQVKAGGSELMLSEKQPVDILLTHEGGFKPLKVAIFTGDGKLVREIPINQEDAKSIVWDGKNADGVDQTSGKYLYRVSGQNKDGKAQEMKAEMSGKVVGVEMVDKNPLLILNTPSGQTKVELKKVVNVAAEESKASATTPTLQPPATAEKPQPAAPVAENISESAWPRGVGDSVQGRMGTL